MPRESFERSNTEQAKSEHLSDVHFYTIQPELNEHPDQRVVLAPGYGLGSGIHKEYGVYSSLMKEVADGSSRVVHSIDSPVGVDKINTYKETLSEKDRVGKAEIKKALAFLNGIEQIEVKDKGVDIVAHSEGAIYATIATALNPNKIRSLILANPAGITEPKSSISHSVAFIKEVLAQFKGDKSQKLRAEKSLQSTIRHMLQNASAASKQSAEIPTANITELIKILKDKGVKVYILSGKDDILFEEKDIKQALDEIDVDGHYPIKGKHNDILLKDGLYSEVINQIIEKLDNNN